MLTTSAIAEPAGTVRKRPRRQPPSPARTWFRTSKRGAWNEPTPCAPATPPQRPPSARFRLLCAHRRGPCGVSTWNDVVESWLANELDRFDEDGWYVGRPLLVTRNDYGPRLYNGDTGVIVARDGGRRTRVFETEAAVSAALDRPAAHASGFARRLWS